MRSARRVAARVGTVGFRTRGGRGRLASEAGKLHGRGLATSVELVLCDVSFDDVERLALWKELPGTVAGVETNQELEVAMGLVHAVCVDTDDDAVIARRELALRLLLQRRATHVERLEALHVDFVLVLLDEIADVVVVAVLVSLRQNLERRAVERVELVLTVWKVN